MSATDAGELPPWPSAEERIAERARLEQERDDARRVAYILAHAYDHDTRPPTWALLVARSYKL